MSCPILLSFSSSPLSEIASFPVFVVVPLLLLDVPPSLGEKTSCMSDLWWMLQISSLKGMYRSFHVEFLLLLRSWQCFLWRCVVWSKSLSSWRNWKRACALCFLHANVCKLLPITVFPVASIPSWFSLVCGWSRIEEDLVAPSFHLFAGSLFWNQIWPYFFFIYYWILYIVYQLIYFSKNTWNMYSNFPHYVFQY